MSTVLAREFIDGWKTSDEKIELGGLTPSARAFTISELIVASDRRIAVVCADSDEAARMHQDIRAFLTIRGRSDLAAAFDFFPGWEHSPYRSITPSIKNRIRRMRTLTRALRGELRGLVTDVSALAQRCPSGPSIASRAFDLKVGDAISREELTARLEQAGYTRNDPVEDPGTYTTRGGLFDIFSPSSRQPLRLDFFGDELETIRTYDPISQRSASEALTTAAVVPVTEWSLSTETLARAKQSIKAFCDEFDVHKKARDAFFEQVNIGIRDPALEYLSPFFSPDDTTWLADLLGADWRVAVSDRLGVESAYDSLVDDLKSGFSAALAEGRIAAPWAKLYIEPDRFGAFLDSRVALQLDGVLLGVPEEAPVADADVDAAERAPVWSPRSRARLVDNSDLKPSDSGKVALDPLLSKIKAWTTRGFARVFVASTSSQTERIHYLLTQKDVACRVAESVDWTDRSTVQIVEGALSSGFRLTDSRVAIVTDSEIFGQKKPSRAKTVASKAKSAAASFVPSLEDLNPNELVVHALHGIGRYRGLVKLELDRVPQDFLLIEYAGADKLYVPVYRLDQVQRYIGAPDGAPLDKLGSQHFERSKAKVKGELQDLAHQLLQLYAKRETREGFAFPPPDEAYREFEARFAFAETADQQRAIEDVADDMSSSKIMDRLICGDVGYGKTEVAMRAAFRAVHGGKQVAVLVPTTILALQHGRSFTERFKGVGCTIGVLSRFRSAKDSKAVLEEARAGRVDIVIGTHRLLSKDVGFKDLGLLIVDEEQRFGVEHKERLKDLRAETDVLTLTATPIPRTLQFSLMGLRDITVINTPPVDRLSVRTYVARFDDDVIRKAIRQELGRGGQVFFIHNRVQSIEAMADRLRAISPEARVIVAHGQMDERELEKRMLAFYNKEADVLLCSTIIESGLDIPSANTMIINRADAFGLAQLYQLRGRVGRSQSRAYCYLLLPEEGSVTDDAKKRLDVIQRFVELGSGFKIASHDLELRGGGEFLGKSQSGHIAMIGFELYTELLDDVIREMRGQEAQNHFDPEIKLPVPALLTESYVPEVHQRLGLYKRLSQAETPEALHELELELQDRYGKPSPEAKNLIWLIRIKQLLRKYHIKTLVAGAERTALDASSGAKLSPSKALALIAREPKTYSLTPDSKIIIKRPFVSAQHLLADLEALISMVADA